jgi:hypothetical protein
VHINMVKALANQLRSIEVKIENEDVYMVLFMSLPPSFDNLVTMTFNLSLFDYFMKFPIEKKVKVQKMPHCLTKFIRKMKSFAFIIKNLDTL